MTTKLKREKNGDSWGELGLTVVLTVGVDGQQDVIQTIPPVWRGGGALDWVLCCVMHLAQGPLDFEARGLQGTGRVGLPGSEIAAMLWDPRAQGLRILVQ